MKGLDGMVPGGPSQTHTHPGSGLQVILKRIKGLTKPQLLDRPYHFQMAPLEEFGWDAAATWNDYVTVRGGAYSRPGGRQLRQIPMQSLVVDWNPVWAVYVGGNRHNRAVEPGGSAPNPRKVAWELDKLLTEESPFRLVVWNKALDDYPELNLAVTLRTFSPRERVGEMDSRYLEMSFSEYRRPQMRHRGYGMRKSLPAKVRVDKHGVAQEVLGKKLGDKIGTPKNPCTFRRLSTFYYGEASMWHVLAAYNGVPGFPGSRPFTKLPRNGRKHRALQIPRKDSFRAGVGKARPAI